MSIDPYILLTILGSSILTIIPRVTPFIVTKKMNIPEKMTRWLSFVPVCIFTALIAQELIDKTEDRISVDIPVFLALIPTVLVAAKSKSMIKTVVVGVICTALIRFLTRIIA